MDISKEYDVYKDIQARTNGEIYIGSGETDAISFFAQAAENIQKIHPLIHYHIYSGDAGIVTEKIDKGLIDFGLLIGPFDMTKYD